MATSEESPTIVPYEEPKGGKGQLHVFGNPDATRLIFMCAGYPDDHSAFTPLAKRLAEENACLVGVACLPGYQAGVENLDLPKDGYSFADWVVCLRRALKALRSYSTKSVQETQLTGVYHDWGVVPGLQLSNQAIEEKSDELTPNQLIIFDVLPRHHPKTPNVPSLPYGDIQAPTQFQRTLDGFRMLSYQSALAGSFLVQKWFGIPFLSTLYFGITFKLMGLLGVFPSGPGDGKYFAKNIIPNLTLHRICYKAYPYVSVIGGIFTGKVKSLFHQCTSPMDLEKTPVLYMYGGAKRFNLHTAKVLAILKQEEAAGRPSRVIEVKGAGHWFYYSKFDETLKAVQAFLEATAIKKEPVSKL